MKLLVIFLIQIAIFWGILFTTKDRLAPLNIIQVTEITSAHVLLLMNAYLLKNFKKAFPHSLFAVMGCLFLSTGAFIDFMSYHSGFFRELDRGNILHNLFLMGGSFFFILGNLLLIEKFKKQKEILSRVIEESEKINTDSSEEEIERMKTSFLKEKEKEIFEILRKYYDSLYEKHKLIKTLERRFLYDTLTGVLSSEGLKRYINELIENEEKFSVIFIDLDRLKSVNDRFGHDMGDKFLKYFAKKLSEFFRAGDKIGRLGGDEFLIVLRNCPEEKARKKIEEAEKNFPPFSPEDDPTISINVSFSYGVEEWKEGMSLREVIKRADEKMYRMKRSRFNVS